MDYFKAVIFQIGTTEYGLHIEQVASIERMQQIQEFPQMPKHVVGIMDLRGTIIPVVDLRTVLQQEQNMSYSDMPLIIIVHVEERLIGLVVDDATDILDIPVEALQSMSLMNSFLRGVVKMEERLFVMFEPNILLKQVSDMEMIKD